MVISMGLYAQSIEKQILEVCMEIFDSFTEGIQDQDDLVKDIMPSGMPAAMIIAEFKSCTRSLNKIKEGYNSKEFISAWRYCNGKLESIHLTKEPTFESARGEYFPETYARFAFSEEKKILYLNIYFAHLYARGWMYPLISSETGLMLGEPELIWLS